MVAIIITNETNVWLVVGNECITRDANIRMGALISPSGSVQGVRAVVDCFQAPHQALLEVSVEAEEVVSGQSFMELESVQPQQNVQ